MASDPLAYFITFSTYGAWLHGREFGSVDKEHNQPGAPFLPSDDARESRERSNMRDAPYLLDASKRSIVLNTILEGRKASPLDDLGMSRAFHSRPRDRLGN